MSTASHARPTAPQRARDALRDLRRGAEQTDEVTTSFPRSAGELWHDLRANHVK